MWILVIRLFIFTSIDFWRYQIANIAPHTLSCYKWNNAFRKGNKNTRSNMFCIEMGEINLKNWNRALVKNWSVSNGFHAIEFSSTNKIVWWKKDPLDGRKIVENGFRSVTENRLKDCSFVCSLLLTFLNI